MGHIRNTKKDVIFNKTHTFAPMLVGLIVSYSILVASGLFCNFTFQLAHIITFAPILIGLIVSYGIIRFVRITVVTVCYWVTPPSPEG